MATAVVINSRALAACRRLRCAARGAQLLKLDFVLRQVARGKPHVLAQVRIEVRIDALGRQLAQQAEHGQRVRQLTFAQAVMALARGGVGHEDTEAHEHRGEFAGRFAAGVTARRRIVEGLDQITGEIAGEAGNQRHGLEAAAPIGEHADGGGVGRQLAGRVGLEFYRARPVRHARVIAGAPEQRRHGRVPLHAAIRKVFLGGQHQDGLEEFRVATAMTQQPAKGRELPVASRRIQE